MAYILDQENVRKNIYIFKISLWVMNMMKAYFLYDR